jgi:hypothetical protein
MNNYLAKTPPNWRDKTTQSLIFLSISPKSRQSGEISKSSKNESTMDLQRAQ